MWFRGHVDPFWCDSYKKFEYTKQNITCKEIETWRNQGYTHQSFTGVMYDSSNEMPDWVNFVARSIGLKKTGFVFYKMQTGDIMPTHIDHFSRYCEIFNVERKDVWRAIVFLDNWKSGHYFEVENTAVCNYKKGDYVLWNANTPHAASNIGIEDRYTLQITGLLEWT